MPPLDTRSAVTGTHTGAVAGVPPSNRPFSDYIADFFRFDEQGMMIEGWVIGKGDVKLALEALHEAEPAQAS